ncbi:MAG: nuclear transport factor 2 family protein [Acidimicrobiales bacterium]
MNKTVEQYLDALGKKEWSRLGGTLTDDRFERVGPFADVVGSSKEYVAFLDRVVTPLDEYRIEPRRSVEGDGIVYAEVTESFVHDGTKMEFPEVLVFDTRDGLISRVQVYMMRPGDEPPIEGASA